MPSPRIASIVRAGCAVLCLVPALQAAAQGADTALLRTRSLAAQCAQCHGTDGHAGAGSEVPDLAGQRAPAIVERMKAFRAGTRPSTVMQQLAKGFSDAQIEQLARYFAAAGQP